MGLDLCDVVCDVCDMKTLHMARAGAEVMGAAVTAGTVTAAGAGVVRREILGIAVRFYKRGNSAFYTFDFGRGKERVQRASEFTVMKDAEWEAAVAVRKWVEERSGKTQAERLLGIQRGQVCTVGDVLRALDEGAKAFSDSTLRVYKGSLLRVARVVDELQPKLCRLDEVLTDGVLTKFCALGQGLKQPNWSDALDENEGLNAALRNVKALFRARVVKLKMEGLKLPDLRVLREFPYLRVAHEGFVPWPAEVYERMHKASEGLRTADFELWLINAMLRRLGLRDEELLKARRDWLEVKFEPPGDGLGPPRRRVWLVLKDRGEEFRLLKHGAPRRLELDAELQEVLLARAEGWLVGPGLLPNPRYDLIYRKHNAWMRKWIPERTKGNHELRMWAGSKVYMKHGLAAAAYFLGHKSQKTTERYYATWLQGAPMLSAACVSTAG